MRRPGAILLGLAAVGLWFVVGLLLPGCGGEGSDDPQYALSIDGAQDRSISLTEVTLTGTGFLPMGSTCTGGCSGLLPPPVFGTLGPYALTWRNESTGQTHTVALTWICNCGGGAPSWIAQVPLAQGVNRITFTMTASGHEQAVTVTVTRV
jgi:hypothetical protein